MNKEKIRNLQVIKDSTGKITRVGFYFGMGHFLEVRVDEKGKIIFCLGETHHGIEIDVQQVLADSRVTRQSVHGGQNAVSR